MEIRLSAKGLRFLSYVVISIFSLAALLFFFMSIDRTVVILLISIFLLALALYVLWTQNDIDPISLLIFFFGTTACFSLFSGMVMQDYLKFIGILIFALLGLILSNYLLNTATPIYSTEKSIYKITLAIIFTEIFWILSFINASPIARGALTAVLFFYIQYLSRGFLQKKINKQKVVILSIASIIFLAIIIYRI